HIEFYRSGNMFLGRLAWLRQPNDEKGRPAVDENNPDPRLRKQPILGLVIIHAVYTGGDSWKGRVYDPDSGKTYNCLISLKGAGTLKLRGYLGLSIFGRTETWTRVKSSF
ncbi:MAG: DUF2147 domain-containing protein, partial [Nitrospiraceae bacterium]|nr:DUF2147 domain-containing protein [Nitrospiraceae bacterium]